MNETIVDKRSGPAKPVNGTHAQAATMADLAATLERIDRRLSKLEASVARLDAMAAQAPATIATVVDTVDGIAARLVSAGVDLDERARVIARVAERLTAPEALATVEEVLSKVDTVRALLRSGVLDPAPVGVVAKAGEALAKAASESPPMMSAFAAFRALGRPDVQRATGFLLRVAQLFGRALEDHPALPEAKR